MVRFRYVEDVTPPAPFVQVTLRRPDRSQEVGLLLAQVDSGASRTVLPARIVEDLGLIEVDRIPLMGLGGNVIIMPTFLVQVEIRQLVPLTVEVVANSNEPFVLLGRDVLNHFRLLLDGPNLTLEIG